MYQGNKVLDDTARKRLSAIRKFTEFGSGFKIAMRDLDIRGAGNLLGREQHGNMNLVGYDMYCSLLGEAVARLRGEKTEEKKDVLIELKIDVHIPDTYIDSEEQRFEMYKRVSDIVTEEDYYNMQSELIDRFGDMPKSVENLIDCMYIRSLAEKLNIESVVRNEKEVMFTIGDNISPEAIVSIMHDYKGKIMFSSGEKSYLNYKYENNMLYNIKIILQKLVNITQEVNQQL
jgi:transcription-repair coupling factor (superfamily II helicase)